MELSGRQLAVATHRVKGEPRRHDLVRGAVVYLELYDPGQRSTLVIGYSIGTTAEDGATRRAAHPLDYAPRIVRARHP